MREAMRMRKVTMLSAGLACLTLFAAGNEALARSNNRRPLVVERRSFLDPGNVVPVGTTNRYVLQQTFFRYDPVNDNQRGLYGAEVLPRRMDVIPYDPGWPIDDGLLP